jgi:hypothetical protein
MVVLVAVVVEQQLPEQEVMVIHQPQPHLKVIMEEMVLVLPYLVLVVEEALEQQEQIFQVQHQVLVVMELLLL